MAIEVLLLLVPLLCTQSSVNPPEAPAAAREALLGVPSSGTVLEQLFAYQQAAHRLGPVDQALLLPAAFWADLRTLRRNVAGDNGLVYTIPECLWSWWWLLLLGLWALVFLPWFWLRKEELASRRTVGLALCSLLALGLTVTAFWFGQAAHAPGTWLDASRPLFVVKEAATLRQGNGLSYPAVVHEGRTVMLRPGTEGWRRAERSNGWVQVELTDGTVGWLPRANLLLQD